MQWTIRLLYALMIIVVAAVGVLFCLRNNQLVNVDLVLMQAPELPLFIWVLGSFVLGGAIGVFVSSFAIVRLRLTQRGMSRRLVRKEAEVNRLRSDSTRAA